MSSRERASGVDQADHLRLPARTGSFKKRFLRRKQPVLGNLIRSWRHARIQDQSIHLHTKLTGAAKKKQIGIRNATIYSRRKIIVRYSACTSHLRFSLSVVVASEVGRLTRLSWRRPDQRGCRGRLRRRRDRSRGQRGDPAGGVLEARLARAVVVPVVAGSGVPARSRRRSRRRKSRAGVGVVHPLAAAAGDGTGAVAAVAAPVDVIMVVVVVVGVVGGGASRAAVAVDVLLEGQHW